jgi:hypothetical protein
MKANDKSSRMNCVCGIVSRLVLVVSLWQAPVPWIHSHDTNVADDASPLSTCEFAEHLHAFHGLSAVNSNVEFGWHCHWILPPWMHAVDENGKDDGHSQDSSTVNSVLPVPTSFSSSVSFLLIAMQETGTLYKSGFLPRAYPVTGIVLPQFCDSPFSAVLRC